MQANQTYDLLTLFQRIASGDEAAFSDLFYQFGPRLHSFLTGITKSETAAEELVQNSFIRIWLSRYQLPDIQNPSAWIYRVASNEAFNFLKRKGIEQKALRVIGPADEWTHTDEVAYNELKRNVAEAVASLPDKRRRIWQMAREEGLKIAEIAEELNISVNTVKASLTEAQKNIREFLSARGFWMLAILFMRW
ncbi:MAG: RNA polymerase sigma-70 factor [Chitinophagaceae bacterium]|nr:RNA polymerase sigma-70 factor [Chitinophagaceae bacterium]